MLEQRAVGVDEIGFGQQFVPARVLHEGPFDVQVADLVAALVVVQQAVETHRRAREDHLPYPDIGLNGSRRPQPHECQTAFFALLLPRGEIDVGQRVQLRHGDVDVPDADARREDRHAFAPVGTRHGAELAVRNLALPTVEIFGHERHAARVPHQDHRVGQLSGTQMQVEYRTVVVDNQFGSGDRPHNCRFLIFIIGIKVIYLPRISKFFLIYRYQFFAV